MLTLILKFVSQRGTALFAELSEVKVQIEEEFKKGDMVTIGYKGNFKHNANLFLLRRPCLFSYFDKQSVDMCKLTARAFLHAKFFISRRQGEN